jgi:hypothetical protein
MNFVNAIGVKESISKDEMPLTVPMEMIFMLFVEEYSSREGDDIKPSYTLHRVRTQGKYYNDLLQKIPQGSLIEVEGRLSNRLYPHGDSEVVMTDILVDDCFGKIVKLHTTSKLRRFPVLPKEEEEIFA